MMPVQQNTDQVSLQYLLNGMVSVRSDVYVGEPSVDARQITSGGLFLAVSGAQSHGLMYAEQAINAGASAIVFEPSNGGELLAEKIKKQSGVALFALPNLNEHLSEISARFYQQPSAELSVVGITGTNGKTSVSHFIAQAMNDDQVNSGVIGTLGWGKIDKLEQTINTTPDAVSVQKQLASLLACNTSVVAMEVSSHGLDQGRVNAVEFKGAVFTNLSHDHLDYHQTMAAYGQAKLELFTCKSLQFVVLNRDDAFCDVILKALSPSVTVMMVSRSSHQLDCDNGVLISNEQLTQAGVSFDVILNGHSVHVQSSLFGRFNIDNLVSAMAVLVAMGDTLEDAATSIQKAHAVDGRMQVVASNKNNPTVLVDYAHTPDALRLALLSLREHGDGKLTLVFGCGGNRDEVKRPLMGAIAAELADEVIVTSDNPRFESADAIAAQIQKGMAAFSAVEIELDRAAAIDAAVLNAGNDDIVLIAGKGHETYQQIGDEKRAFNDVDEVKKALTRRAGGVGCKS